MRGDTESNLAIPQMTLDNLKLPVVIGTDNGNLVIKMLESDLVDFTMQNFMEYCLFYGILDQMFLIDRVRKH